MKAAIPQAQKRVAAELLAARPAERPAAEAVQREAALEARRAAAARPEVEAAAQPVAAREVLAAIPEGQAERASAVAQASGAPAGVRAARTGDDDRRSR